MIPPPTCGDGGFALRVPLPHDAKVPAPGKTMKDATKTVVTTPAGISALSFDFSIPSPFKLAPTIAPSKDSPERRTPCQKLARAMLTPSQEGCRRCKHNPGGVSRIESTGGGAYRVARPRSR